MPCIHLISALPHFVSPDEHRALVASTPASFNDIPPVARHIEHNVAVALDPPLVSFPVHDLGSLYVLTSVLVYMSPSGSGFQIEYPAITLHAVSRADPRPSIYCQLDEHAGEDVPADHDALSDMRELTIVPKDPASLDPIFEALSQCAALHPDKNISSDEDDFDDAIVDANGAQFEVFTGDEEQELSQVGRAALAHLESIIYDPYDHAQSQPNGAHSEQTDEKKSEQD